MNRAQHLARFGFPTEQAGKFTLIGTGFPGGKAKDLIDRQTAI